MEKMNFVTVPYESMKKIDKRGYSTLYLYWLENGKAYSFDLPLFIGDDGKGVLSVEAFKRVFYAFQEKIGLYCIASIVSGNDGENSYNVIHIETTFEAFKDINYLELENYEAPKKSEVKRESSAKIAKASKAKKAEAEAKKAEAEAVAEVDWNKKAVVAIGDYLQSKFPDRIDNNCRTMLEADILKILNNIQ